MKLRSTAPREFEVEVGDAVLLVCPLSLSAINAISKANTDYVKGVPVPNSIKILKEMFDRTAKAFIKGMDDEDGKPLVCDTATKYGLCDHDATFVNDVFAKIDALEALRRTGEMGNSQPGASGTSPKGK